MTCSSSAARAGLVGLVVAAAAITVTGCGAVEDEPTSVVEREPVAHPYSGAMHVEQDFDVVLIRGDQELFERQP